MVLGCYALCMKMSIKASILNHEKKSYLLLTGWDTRLFNVSLCTLSLGCSLMLALVPSALGESSSANMVINQNQGRISMGQTVINVSEVFPADRVVRNKDGSIDLLGGASLSEHIDSILEGSVLRVSEETVHYSGQVSIKGPSIKPVGPDVMKSAFYGKVAGKLVFQASQGKPGNFGVLPLRVIEGVISNIPRATHILERTHPFGPNQGVFTIERATAPG